jgi:mannose-6-phosphate isomerase-like protein (cupin superfamily)
MRTILILTVIAAAALLAQRGMPPPAKTFTSAAEVEAMIAKAKQERKPDQANFQQPLLRLAPYSASLEYRAEGVDSPPTVHETQAELVYVVDGAGTLVIGGKLIGEKRSSASNLQGTGIEGGTPQRIAKGDYVFVPENTAHAFIKTEGRLVIMSLHVPRGGSAQ